MMRPLRHGTLFLACVILVETVLLAPCVLAAEDARQVTVCGIVADPNNLDVDPKLAQIQPQLSKLLPKHGFRLIEVKSKRVKGGQSVVCDLGGGYSAEALLVEPLDENGKVQLKCDLTLNAVSQFSTLVTTPANQLFFCDQKRGDGTHLLIAVGAR
ncbi:MAG: hypothetical protein P4L84_18310 [Isosphaeraceae bacterium]|nr:hypothetical protein [Isosphaeraceae bacterium]